MDKNLHYFFSVIYHSDLGKGETNGVITMKERVNTNNFNSFINSISKEVAKSIEEDFGAVVTSVVLMNFVELNEM